MLCLHGGGYSGLTWSLVAQQLKGRWVEGELAGGLVAGCRVLIAGAGG